MALHVQDDETDWLVRDFAKRRGLGITAAIKVAIREASAHEVQAGEILAQKIEPILREIRSLRHDDSGLSDKAFDDSMWETD